MRLVTYSGGDFEIGTACLALVCFERGGQGESGKECCDEDGEVHFESGVGFGWFGCCVCNWVVVVLWKMRSDDDDDGIIDIKAVPFLYVFKPTMMYTQHPHPRFFSQKAA
jgi:hypothetical protein